MKILILGASGFLGGKVHHRLSENPNFKVVGTSFKSCKNNEFIKINIKNENEIEEMFNENKADAVVWCLLDMSNEEELINIGLRNAMKNLNDNTKFIYISTDAFVDGKGNYSEDVSLKYYPCSNPLSGYINAKIEGEKVVKNHKNYVIIRTGPLYGQDVEGNWDKRVISLIEALSANRAISRSSNLYKTFVYVDNLADLIYEVIEMDFNGIIHVGPEEKESYYTFNRKMAEKLGLDEKLIAEDIISNDSAIENGIPLDTSMNTSKCRSIFKTEFKCL